MTLMMIREARLADGVRCLFVPILDRFERAVAFVGEETGDPIELTARSSDDGATFLPFGPNPMPAAWMGELAGALARIRALPEPP